MSASVDDGSSAAGTTALVFLGMLVALVLVLVVAAAAFRRHNRATRKLARGTVEDLRGVEVNAALQTAAWAESKL